MRHLHIVLVLIVFLQGLKTAQCQESLQHVSDSFQAVHRLSRMSQEIADRWGRPRPSRVKTLLQETEKALSKFPDDRSLLWLKGYCLTQLGRLEEAEQFYRRLLAQTPLSSAWRDSVREMLAWVQWKKGDYKGAWQNSLAHMLRRELTWLVLPLLPLAVLARVLQRWIGGWAQLQVWAILLLGLWRILVTHLTAWLVLGVPFATVVGNKDSYRLLSDLFFWTGVLLFAYLWRQRCIVHLSAVQSAVPRWLYIIALVVGVSMPAYDAIRLYMIGFSPDLERTFDHITVQAIVMLLAGIPALSAVYVWWLIGTLYRQARMELSALGDARSCAIAIGWIVLLWSAWHVTMAGALDITLLRWGLVLPAYLLTYERTGQLWVPWLLLTAWRYTFVVPPLLTAIGQL